MRNIRIGVQLSVVNGLDGAGTSVRRPGNIGGYGLTSMRERLRPLNGTLRTYPKENERAVTAELTLAAAKDGVAR